MKPLFSVLVVGLFLFSCGKTSNPDADLTFEGSNTSKNLVELLATNYNSSSKKKIKVKGGGSEKAIESFLHGNIKLLNSSRKLNADEIRTAEKNQGGKVKEIIIALDAVALIVNPKLGVHELSIAQIGQIYSGVITNWKEVGGPDLKIRLLGRDKESGTQHFFKEKFIEENYAPGLIEKEDPAEIVKDVQEHIGAIGYVDLAHISQKEHFPVNSIWPINISIDGQESVSPFERLQVYEGIYPLTRPIFQYIVDDNTPEVKSFIAFELSKDGQKIVETNGFFPLQSIHQQFNKKQGF